MAPNFSISAEVQQESFGDQDVKVSFAKLGKGLGSFHWPTGNDLSTIARRSIVDFQPAVRATWRWEILVCD